MANNLTESILKTLDQHAPVVNTWVKPNAQPKGWWCKELSDTLKERDILYKRAIITKKVEDWEAFKRTRNYGVSLLRRCKTEYYRVKIEECRGDSKEMWSTLKELLKGKRRQVKEEIKFKNIIITEEAEICEEFNTYFIKSIEEIRESIPKN